MSGSRAYELKHRAKLLMHAALRRFGIDLIRYDAAAATDRSKRLGASMDDLMRLRDLLGESSGGGCAAFVDYCRRRLTDSKSQRFQDLFALFQLQEKKGGFFVEFGATDGVTLSNTHLLEKAYGWKGILAEPARSWHEDLKKNRACAIETRCVWTKSGERLKFSEFDAKELSTVAAFSDRPDEHLSSRKNGRSYVVETISLNDLLDAHGAPRVIDYMSVDTEGSELRILESFDFSKREVRIVTVEHNYSADREKIQALLESQGFTRTFSEASGWDDWYVRASRG